MWNQAAAFFKSGPKVQYGWIHTNLLKLRPGPVSLLFSKLANPEAKTGTIEIPVTYSRIGEGTGTAKNPFLAQIENEAAPGYGTKRRVGVLVIECSGWHRKVLRITL